MNAWSGRRPSVKQSAHVYRAPSISLVEKRGGTTKSAGTAHNLLASPTPVFILYSFFFILYSLRTTNGRPYIDLFYADDQWSPLRLNF
jgi:hypothetical protein